MTSEKLRVLIVGYGRAGKRHGKILDGRRIEWGIADTDENACISAFGENFRETWWSVGSALEISKRKWDLVIICTPPSSHLDIIQKCLDYGVPKILCEKPLCGLGQMEEARKLAEKAGDQVSVAYNWQWHPHVLHLCGQEAPVELVHLYSLQHRPDLPDWGLLLDDVSHGLDTLRQVVDGEPKIDLAVNRKASFSDPLEGTERPGFEDWTVQGMVGGCKFVINEIVYFDEDCPPRECFISVDHVRHDLDTASETLEMMYRWMWDDVLTWVDEDLERPPVTMADALETQALLEKANELNEKQKAYFAEKAARGK